MPSRPALPLRCPRLQVRPRAIVVVVESLEARQLLHSGHVHAFAANINFQPQAAAAFDGYLVDAGHAFADRGNGYAYGWS